MDDKNFRENLDRYLDGELDEKQVLEMEKYIASNPLAAMEVENEKKFNTLVKNHIVREEAPYELREAVIERIEKEQVGFLGKILNLPWLKSVPSLTAATAVVVIFAFTAVSIFSRPFPVFAESIDRHMDYLKGGFPMEIQTNSVEEAMKWFEGKCDFAIARPHLKEDAVEFKGARICHLKDRKVAYFMYEKDGHDISAFVMDFDGAKIPKAEKQFDVENGAATVYIQSKKGFKSVICHHKKPKTGCIFVTDLPEDIFMDLMG